MKTFVLYRKNCMDGKLAALAAAMALKSEPTFIAVDCDEPVPEEVLQAPSGSHVYILALPYKHNLLEHMHDDLGLVLHGIDRCITIKAMPKRLAYVNLTGEKSSAVLAWEYFHPEEPVPLLFLYAQEQALGKWELDASRQINAALSPADSFADLFDLLQGGEKALRELIDYGALKLGFQYELIQEHLANFRVVPYGKYWAAVGACSSKTIVSDLGAQACRLEGADFSICHCINNEFEVMLSFRSMGEFDVSKLAEELDGGGQKNIASATVTMPSFLTLFQ